VLWLVIALPASAVIAGLSSWAIAASRGDRELPSAYHWEGGALDRDDARRAAAAGMGLRATLRVDVASGRCLVTLEGASPATLRLDLTHPTDQAADRHVQLQGAAGVYSGACAQLPAAHWWLQLTDDQGAWMLRGRAAATAAHAALTATLP